MKTRKNKNNFRQTRPKRQRGGTPEQDSQLLAAIISGNFTGAQVLLDAGANVNASYYDTPALMWATIGGNEEIVRMLLHRGANVNASYSGSTSLIWASNRGNEEIVRMLLDAEGVNVNASMSDGKTALYWATTIGNKEIVQMLLDRGADVNASASNGETALMLARERLNPEIIQIIETHIQSKKDLNNYEMVKSAVKEGRASGLPDAGKAFLKLEEGQGPTLRGWLAPKSNQPNGGKRKTRKTRKSRSKRQRGRKL
jgi:ankyrin repeat protein